MNLSIEFNDILGAAERIRGVAHLTPVLTSQTVNEICQGEVHFKAENLQRMGAFKFRGAYNALAQFTPSERTRGVIAYSSGNHAQAIALSAKILGMPSFIVMPKDAPASKIAATRGYQSGDPKSEVLLFDRYTQNREEIGKRISDERGMKLIPPYDHPHIMAGQGTAGLELVHQVAALNANQDSESKPLDLLLVCVGGGGLIAGCAVAAKHLGPSTDIWGVEPEAGNDTQQSLLQGKIVHIETPQTIADGAQTQHSGELTFPVIQKLVRGIVTVSDQQLIAAMRFMAERMKIVVEPTGALAAAALLSKVEGLPDLKGKRIGVILSGGNVDPSTFARFLSGR